MTHGKISFFTVNAQLVAGSPGDSRSMMRNQFTMRRPASLAGLSSYALRKFRRMSEQSKNMSA